MINVPSILDARVEITPIDGLELQHTRVIGDPRGLLAELVPGGSMNPILAPGFGNCYVSIATGKHIGRAGHFHFANRELFFTLTGTAVWYFSDCRADSPTFGRSYSCVLGFRKPETSVPDPVYVLEDKDMVRCVVPTGVWHGYWPLTDEPVCALALASVPHDNADFDRRGPAALPGCIDHLARYGIAIP